MQIVSKSLDISLSSLIASSVNEYLHQVSSEKGTQTVELEIARFAYAKKKILLIKKRRFHERTLL